jgi:LmbE family N-acetylglucosaminyl deacetylase
MTCARRRCLAVAALVLTAGLAGCGGREAVKPEPTLRFTRGDRVLVLAPHPDDEVLGCGGIIQEALAVGARVRVCFLTYGDSDEWSFAVYRKFPVLGTAPTERMGEVRRKEALASCRSLGVSDGDVIFLGYPDFGTMQILRGHWGDRQPLRGALTGATAVPYADALRPGAPYKGEEIVRDLRTIVADLRPTAVFVSHAADRNPDHEALYVFARIALWDAGLAPGIFPYLVHYHHWPVPFGYRPESELEPPRDLAGAMRWHSVPLARGVVERKKAALEAHRTQIESAGHRLLSFVRRTELFGDYAPVVLSAARVPATVLQASGGGEAAPQEELTQAERAAFLGFEERTIALEGDTLVFSATFSRPFSDETSFELHAFGYRTDTAFEDMPKLNVRVGLVAHTATDQDRAIPAGSVAVERSARGVVVRVPLATLGRPERVVTAGRTYFARVPLDWVAWRVIELPSAH